MQYKIYRDYYIYADGRIESHKYQTPRILKPKQRKNGYLSVTLRIDGTSEEWLVHRLVATLFIPNPEHKPQVDHIDGDKTNNNVQNLKWCTPKENYHNPNTIKKHATLNGQEKVYVCYKEHRLKDGTIHTYKYNKYYKGVTYDNI